jgi:CubicO group peptidase (beta-lactamase class C family)
LIIERLMGACWDEALASLILEPAGLTESVTLAEQLPYRHVAVGHEPGVNGSVVAQNWTFSRGMGPSGSTLATTAADLARFGQLLLDGGVGRGGTRVLAESAVRELLSPQIDVPARWFADQWCVGPYRKVWDGVEAFGHGGTTMQSSSTLTWIPELGLSVSVIVNNPSLGYPFAHALLGELLLTEFSIEKPKRPVHDPNASFDAAQYVGEYRTLETNYRVTAGDTGRLLLTMDSHALFSDGAIESELQPIGDHRFLAVDDRVTTFHNWDLAFSDITDGKARLLHNGGFAAARV